jgi:hypothetical protein
MPNAPKRPFHTAADADIKSGEVSDVYFARTVQILTRQPLIGGGRVVRDLPPPRTIRDFVLEQPRSIPLDTLRRQGLRRDF